MKINWKVLVALVLIIGVIAWTVNSIRSTSYSGTKLSFEVGGGTVSMTNPSSETVPVQLVGSSGHSFSVSSTVQGISGLATRVGNGTNATFLLEFELPPGVSEFTVERSTDVKFVADTNTQLKATVHATNKSRKIEVAAVIILGALFFMSYTTEHRWLYKLLGKEPASKLHSLPYTGEQDNESRAYGDNRMKKSGTPHSHQP